MEVLTIVLTILLVLLLVMSSAKAVRLRHHIGPYVKLRNLIKKPKPAPPEPPDTRMFVAIRRQPAGRVAFSSLDIEEFESSKAEVKAQLMALLEGWIALTGYESGFHGSEYGLLSGNDENWRLFATFEVANHDVFLECLTLLSQEQFFALKNQLDIRLLYGKKMENMLNHIDELFS